MKLEIRNLQSQATYEIDPEGAVLGREGAKADIVLKDQAVSKKHAKIYEKNGRWYLEDLASSNGTFVDNRRITEPVVLAPGAVFALSENQFEVVQIINGANGKAEPALQDNLDDLPPLGMMSGDDSQDGKRSSRPMLNKGARGASPAQAADPADDMPPPAADQKGVGYFFIAVPKAIAFYLAAIPLMALNPVGSIRKGIEEQRFPAMGPMQLIAYALPAQLFLNLLGVIIATIVSLVAGAFILPIVPLITAIIVAIVGSVITGFIWHPVLRWIINFLKGESDEKSRTNYFIATYTAIALTAVPSALAALLGLVPLPFINILPVLITLVASLISFFVFYSWMKHFNVVAWFQKVMMVLGVLILLGAGFNLVTAVLSSISSLGSGGGSGAVAAADMANLTAEQREAMAAAAAAGADPEALKKAQEAAMAAAAAAGGMDPEAIKKAQEAAMAAAAAGGADPEAIKKAQEAAAKATEDAVKAAEAAAKAAAGAGTLTAEQQEAIKKAQEQAAAATAQGEKDAALAAAAATKAAEDAKRREEALAAKERELAKKEAAVGTAAAIAAKAPVREAAPPLESEAAAIGLPPGYSPGFQDFLAKRTAFETALEKDPTLLKKKDVLPAYERYLKKTWEIRNKWSKKKPKDPALQKVNDRLKDIEVYESTTKLVQEVYEKVYR